MAVSIEEDGNFGQTDDDLNIEIAASYTGIDNVVLSVAVISSTILTMML